MNIFSESHDTKKYNLYITTIGNHACSKSNPPLNTLLQSIVRRLCSLHPKRSTKMNISKGHVLLTFVIKIHNTSWKTVSLCNIKSKHLNM